MTPGSGKGLKTYQILLNSLDGADSGQLLILIFVVFQLLFLFACFGPVDVTGALSVYWHVCP